jgi:hypothetical protein
MEKVAFVTYADGGYVKPQQVLIRSIRRFYPDVAIFAFNSPAEIHPECPPHAISPYGFKVYAVEYARAKGYDVIIWLDSPNRLVRRIEPWLEEIATVGVYLQKDGWMCGQWANDKCLQYFGVTRDEAMQIPNIYACIYGFDFRHPVTETFFRKWKAACQAGMFYGKGKNTQKTESQDERCLGHRYDQTCAELIAHQMGLPLSPFVLGETRYFLSWIEV